jgi:G3E family GTPase
MADDAVRAEYARIVGALRRDPADASELRAANKRLRAQNKELRAENDRLRALAPLGEHVFSKVREAWTILHARGCVSASPQHVSSDIEAFVTRFARAVCAQGSDHRGHAAAERGWATPFDTLCS